jgi:cupin fold WbuC family metalloprotein
MRLFADTVLDELTSKAATSPRRRAHFNIHATASDPVQRFLVVKNRDSYIRPHQHLTKSELVVALRGRFDIVTFDPEGRVTNRYGIGAGTNHFAYEADPGTWHTLVALTDGSAFLEVKEGPYDPAVAVDFAPWAPAEGDTSVARCLEWLRTAQPGSILEA